MRSTVVAAAVLVLGGCGVAGTSSPTSDAASPVKATTPISAPLSDSSTSDGAPLTSIPLCPDPLALQAELPIGEPGDEFRQAESIRTAAARRVETVYGSDPAWVQVTGRWDLDTVVFQFTDADPERDQHIAELMDGVPFEIILGGYTRAELLAAHDRLLELSQAASDPYLRGIGPYGGVDAPGRVTIYLSDVTQAASYADQIGLPPPYDIYCVHNENDEGGGFDDG